MPPTTDPTWLACEHGKPAICRFHATRGSTCRFGAQCRNCHECVRVPVALRIQKVVKETKQQWTDSSNASTSVIATSSSSSSSFAPDFITTSSSSSSSSMQTATATTTSSTATSSTTTPSSSSTATFSSSSSSSSSLFDPSRSFESLESPDRNSVDSASASASTAASDGEGHRRPAPSPLVTAPRKRARVEDSRSPSNARISSSGLHRILVQCPELLAYGHIGSFLAVKDLSLLLQTGRTLRGLCGEGDGAMVWKFQLARVVDSTVTPVIHPSLLSRLSADQMRIAALLFSRVKFKSPWQIKTLKELEVALNVLKQISKDPPQGAALFALAIRPSEESRAAEWNRHHFSQDVIADEDEDEHRSAGDNEAALAEEEEEGSDIGDAMDVDAFEEVNNHHEEVEADQEEGDRRDDAQTLSTDESGEIVTAGAADSGNGGQHQEIEQEVEDPDVADTEMVVDGLRQLGVAMDGALNMASAAMYDEHIPGYNNVFEANGEAEEEDEEEEEDDDESGDESGEDSLDEEDIPAFQDLREARPRESGERLGPGSMQQQQPQQHQQQQQQQPEQLQQQQEEVPPLNSLTAQLRSHLQAMRETLPALRQALTHVRSPERRDEAVPRVEATMSRIRSTDEVIQQIRQHLQHHLVAARQHLAPARQGPLILRQPHNEEAIVFSSGGSFKLALALAHRPVEQASTTQFSISPLVVNMRNSADQPGIPELKDHDSKLRATFWSLNPALCKVDGLELGEEPHYVTRREAWSLSGGRFEAASLGERGGDPPSLPLLVAVRSTQRYWHNKLA